MKVDRTSALADIAEVLYVDSRELDSADDLQDHGMDSVRIMELVEKWRSAGVEGIDFIVLAEDQRLGHWLEVLERLQQNGETTDK